MRWWLEDLAFKLPWTWPLRALDKIQPRYDYTGHRSPRIETLTGAAAERAQEIVQKHCEHDWRYLERRPGETYTGYCERCRKCGVIAQIAQ